jgi:hypothetical protein
LKSSANLPLFANFIQALREIFPYVPTECPKKVPYHFEALKINYTDSADDGLQWFRASMANGLYRSVLKFYTKDDPEAFYIEWRSEIYLNKNVNLFI